MAPFAVSTRTNVSIPSSVSGMGSALPECHQPKWMIRVPILGSLHIGDPTQSINSHDAESCGKYHKDHSLGSM